MTINNAGNLNIKPITTANATGVGNFLGSGMSTDLASNALNNAQLTNGATDSWTIPLSGVGSANQQDVWWEICMQRDPLESVPEWEEIASVSMAVQNMWLMASELSIGSYWSSPKLIDFIHEFIPLQAGERCLGIFYMGSHDGVINSREPSPIADKVLWFE